MYLHNMNAMSLGSLPGVCGRQDPAGYSKSPEQDYMGRGTTSSPRCKSSGPTKNVEMILKLMTSFWAGIYLAVFPKACSSHAASGGS